MRYVAMPTQITRHYQTGGRDENGMVPERQVSDGGYCCRHCLKPIPSYAPMLLVAHRPFPALQPYAEVGPLFICASQCEAGGGINMPEIMTSPDYIVRGYSADDRIIYGTGSVVATEAIPVRAEELFGDPRVAYLHVRSARNNCYQCRIDR